MGGELEKLLSSWNLGVNVEELYSYFEFYGVTDVESFKRLNIGAIKEIIPNDYEYYQIFIEKFKTEVVKMRRIDNLPQLSSSNDKENQNYQMKRVDTSFQQTHRASDKENFDHQMRRINETPQICNNDGKNYDSETRQMKESSQICPNMENDSSQIRVVDEVPQQPCSSQTQNQNSHDTQNSNSTESSEDSSNGDSIDVEDNNDDFETALIRDKTPPHERLKLIDQEYSLFQKSRAVYKLLDGTLRGKFILFHYAKNHAVLRKELSRIVMDEALKKTISDPAKYLTLSEEDLFDTYDQILQVFVTEVNVSAYVELGEPEDVEKGTKRRRPTGCLINAVDVLTNTAAEIGLKDPKLGKSKKTTNSVACSETVDLSIFKNKVPTTDEEELKRLWWLAASHRFHVKYPKLSFDEIVDELQILKGTHAPPLIRIDFNYKLQEAKKSQERKKNKVSPVDKFPNTETSQKLIKHWASLALAIVNAALKINKTAVENRKIKDVIPVQINSSGLKNSEYVCVLACKLLPYLIKYKFGSAKYKEWKPTELEVTESFLKHHEDECDTKKIEKIIDDQHSAYLKLAIESPQPYIIVSGPSAALKSIHVVIGKVYYECKTITEALDLCFKSFYSFNLDYSLACVHIWSYFHRHVYEINNSWRVGKTVITGKPLSDFVDLVVGAGGYPAK